jgi:CubicO group peptidase (beta-lactamase class C family)
VENGLLPPVLVKGERGWNILDRMQHYDVPGVTVAVFEDYEVVWARGYGLRDVETEEPVTDTTLFVAGSISKPVTAMAALRLVQEGKMSLDENINTSLTSWKLPDNQFTTTEKATLRRLLTHSAGTTVHGFPGYKPGGRVPTLVQILDGKPPANTSAIRVDVEPGSRWRYSGGGTTIVQQAMIDIEAKPFPAIMYEKVIEPVGMVRSSFEQEFTPEMQATAASGHTGGGRRIPGKRHIYPEMAAAGLWTTATDLARFAIELQRSIRGESNRVLSTEMSQLMVTPQLAVDDGRTMAIGFVLTHGTEYFEHSGGDAGFVCNLVAKNEGGYGAVVMTNSDRPGNLIAEIVRGIAMEYGWEDFLPPLHELVTLNRVQLNSLEGRYLMSADNALTIERKADHLSGHETGFDRFDLFPISETEFIRRDRRVTYSFSRDGGGKADRVSLHADADLQTAARSTDGRKIPLELLLDGEYDRALEAYRELKTSNPDDPAIKEERINMLGYRLMWDRRTKSAVDIFRVNVQLYPESYNVYDSLGEGYMELGETELAIKNYEESIVLNPENTNGRQMLERLRKK